MLLPEVAIYKLIKNNQDQRRCEFEPTFMRSFLLFFPLKLSYVSLFVAMDAERDKPHVSVR